MVLDLWLGMKIGCRETTSSVFGLSVFFIYTYLCVYIFEIRHSFLLKKILQFIILNIR